MPGYRKPMPVRGYANGGPPMEQLDSIMMTGGPSNVPMGIPGAGGPPPEEYVPEEEMYTPPVTITNPAQENLINQQRQTYNSNLSNLVYRAPDIEIDEYVRPMSAAQFGSAPGSAEDVRTPVYKPETEDAIDTDMGFIAMNQGGSLNLNNSSMNRGIGQLPPMQQQDKLTQLFQSSFRPRR